MIATLPTIDVNNTETGCCPVFDPIPWDNKTFHFDNLKFVHATTKSFLHMPLNMGKVFSGVMASINAQKANSDHGYLILSHDKNSWQGEHFFLVDTDVEGQEMTSLNGTFMTKVYDGPFKDMPTMMADLEKHIEHEGHIASDYYAFYTTCPKCAKHYGHNYIVLFGRI